jgi:hypothetical protein
MADLAQEVRTSGIVDAPGVDVRNVEKTIEIGNTVDITEIEVN